MRGLVNYKPFESNLNSFLEDTIYLGVICPQQDALDLFNFLSKQNQEISKSKPNDDFIIDFEGFYKTYGVSLNIPTVSSANWESLNEPNNKEQKYPSA